MMLELTLFFMLMLSQDYKDRKIDVENDDARGRCIAMFVFTDTDRLVRRKSTGTLRKRTFLSLYVRIVLRQYDKKNAKT